jgi:tetratricopeptide (TPR) repeat protein
MARVRLTLLLAAGLLAACASNPDRHTLAELHDVEPDIAEMPIENGLDHAMLAYRKFLEEAPRSTRTPEAMRRLADLKVEKQYGILGDGEYAQLPAPERAARGTEAGQGAPRPRAAAGPAQAAESDRAFERRASGETAIAGSEDAHELELPGGEQVEWAGPLEAIALYDEILATYPNYPHNDQVLYQKARAYDELGRSEEAVATMERLIAEYPSSRYLDEVQFRRAEYFFVRRRYLDAEEAYAAVTALGPGSEYYELALYKLGWTLYKQELYEEALQQYVGLLDYKVSVGYDFDQTQDEADQRRIADTYRVISLAFSSLGGPEAVQAWFAANGERGYEDRIYRELGEFYLEKLRYHDAAASYKTFVGLHPLHRSSPHFSMRVVEIYEAGGFPKLVLEAKKEFAATYALDSEYWQHFDVNDAPEELSYLKRNLEDLAKHYHALYQHPEREEDKPAHFEEASHWYRAFLTSFPADEQTPGINHQLADLLLEHEDFGEAAREYERVAYDYPAHDQAAAAGYAAIYAHREQLKVADETGRLAVKREAVASTLRFVDTFPEDEHAAAVLGAAVDDLYDMKEFEQAITTAQRLIDQYPDAELPIRRDAWAVVAHSAFEIRDFEHSEQAYTQVLDMTPADDTSRQSVVDNLAAAIYEQGEQARQAGDYRAAADHFLRITRAAPTSEIRAAAEYDAGAALIELKEWAEAARVLQAFREAYPDHELHREATKQMAFVYRQEGELSRAAEEYERVAAEAEEPDLRREALLVAGGLYEDAESVDRALAVYLEYVDAFPEPLEVAVETRFKVAELYEAEKDDAKYREQLRRIVEIDRAAGTERTDRVRYLAARSALALTETLYDRFAEVQLVQPFQKHLKEKQRRMSEALDGFGQLVDYEVGEVTAAATFYMAEVYSNFSRSLLASERPVDLDAAAMQDYEDVLEEEAFPFEEKAIAVHEKNLELMAAGIFNPWIQKSLDQLAKLVPGRYAKFESSPGFLASIDRYAYHVPAPPGGPAQETQPAVGGGAGEPAEAGDAAVPAEGEGEAAPARVAPADDTGETAPARVAPADDAGETAPAEGAGEAAGAA